MRELICPICKDAFITSANHRVYCSEECKRTAGNKKAYDSNPTKFANHNHKGYISKTIISNYKGRCAICGWRASEELIKTNTGIQYAYGNEIHHIIPVSQNGSADLDNLILLCPNHHKQANLGLISIEVLRTYLVKGKTEQEKIEDRNRSIDRIANVIFN